jgi:ABC-type glutathione transport system ATPase component
MSALAEIRRAEEVGALAVKMRASALTVRYGAKEALTDVTLDVHAHEILALIGPSGCGNTASGSPGSATGVSLPVASSGR